MAGAVAVAVFDGLIAVGLTACRGARPGASVRAIAEIDALDLPLAVAGGLCGLLVVEVGWWAALVPLVALALVPEIVHARRAASLLALRDSVLAVELLVVGALVALWSGVPDVPTVCVLAAVAVVAGAELVVDRRVPVPPVLGVVVVAVALAVGPDDALFAAALVAGLATAVSWWVQWSSSHGWGDTRGVRRIGARARRGVGGDHRGAERFRRPRAGCRGRRRASD